LFQAKSVPRLQVCNFLCFESRNGLGLLLQRPRGRALGAKSGRSLVELAFKPADITHELGAPVLFGLQLPCHHNSRFVLFL